MTIDTVVTNVGNFFNGSIGWIGNAIDFIGEHPIAFVMVVAMPVAGFAIGGLRRLIRL